jgi:DNA-binding winged helix-turn-helix (wHTH) protein
VPSSNGIYRFGEFELSVRARMLSRRGVGIPLPSKTFEVLHYLVANPGRVVTKDELLKGVWPDSFVEESNLTQHVFRLRKALQLDPDSAPCIVTIPGQGYQFSAVVDSGVETSAIELPEEIVVQTVRERSTFIAEEIVQRPLAQLAPRRAPQRRTIAVTFLAAIAFVALGTWGWNSLRRPGRITLVPIMVSPFENRTGDSSFDLTLSNVLSIDMAQSPYFDVLSKTEFSRTLALMKRPPDERITEALAREICQRSNSRVLVSGAIDKLGTLYPLTIEGTECSTGKTLAN